MKVDIRFFLLGIMVMITTTSVHAADFSIRTIVGEDLVPPSTPAPVTAIPIAPTQIDVSWGMSVDNFSVAGYVLQRDGVYIATTTLLSFSDTGLVPSTTYTYLVQAFDPVFNYSSASALVATSTPPLPPPPPVTPVATSTVENRSGGGSVARVVLDDLSLSSAPDGVAVELTTARPARFELRWGRTASYELGYVTTDRFLRDYETAITGLEPGTTYEYELIGYTPTGTQTILKRGQFTTLSVEAESFAVPNVSQFRADVVGDSVRLTWELPAEPIAHVRIVRSHLGFPQHMNDGAFVYQGNSTSVTDADILQTISPVYYTIFAVTKNGVVSSGAVAWAYRAEYDSAIQIPYVPDRPPLPSQFEPIAEMRSSTTMPELSDIFIKQNDRSWRLGDQSIVLESDHAMTIAIPRDRVTAPVKIIIGTLLDPTNHRQQFSFLLRLNHDGSTYEATLSAPRTNGASQLTIEIYDFSSERIARYSNQVNFTTSAMDTVVLFPDVFFRSPITQHLPTILLVGGVGIIVWILRRRREDND